MHCEAQGPVPKVLTQSLNQTARNTPAACERTTKTYMSNYMKILSALALVIGFAASCCFDLRGSTAAANEEILFRVKVSDVGLQNSSLIKGKQPADWVEIRLPGHLYNPPKRFSPASKQAANWNTPVEAAVADFSAFKADDKDWILEDFLPAEKANIVGLLNDKSAREKNKALFEHRTERFITGEVNYKEYSIVFVRDSGQAHPVPLVFKKTPSGYKRTNALSGDETFDIVFSALYSGGNLTTAK
jgi:hypothetical protein